MQLKPEPKHTHPHRTPQLGVAGYKGGTHTNTHTPTPEPGVAGRSRNLSPSTHPHAAHPWRKVAGYRGSRHTNTHTPTPQPGLAGRSRNPSPNTHTHTAHPSQEWLGASGARTRPHTQPNTPARSGGAQPKPEPKHTHPSRTPQPGEAGYRRSTHTSTHTTHHTSQEWRGAAETRAQTHTATPHTPARSGGVQGGHAHEHTHTPTPQPGVAGRSQNPSPNTHTQGAHPSQEWRGASGAPTQAHTQPSTPARSGGVQPKPEPKHTHPWCAPKPGVAGCKQSGHTSTRQEWRGAAETRAGTHTLTARTQARSGGVQAERPHQHTPGVAGCSRDPSPDRHTHGAHPSQEWRGASRAPTPAHARSGGVQPKPEPKHTHPRRAPKPGVAGCKQSGHTSTRQEWRGAAETRVQTHTPTARTQARSGGVQAERPHQPTPGVAGCSRDPSPNTHTHGAHPTQECRAAAETRAQTHTPTARTPARSGWVQAERPHQHTHSPTPQPGVAGGQPKPEPKPTHPRRARQPGVAGCKQSAHTGTHTAQHPSQEWRGAAQTRAQTHTPMARTPPRTGGVQTERPHKHTHTPTPQPGVAGCS